MVRSNGTSSHMLINATTNSHWDRVDFENALEAPQLVVSKHGYASFKALSKYTNEEYLTEWFSIPHILDYTCVPLLNSS